MLAHKRNSAKTGRRQLQALVRLRPNDAYSHRASTVRAHTWALLGTKTLERLMPRPEERSDRNLTIKLAAPGIAPP
jgi:hypothetical protein